MGNLSEAIDAETISIVARVSIQVIHILSVQLIHMELIE